MTLGRRRSDVVLNVAETSPPRNIEAKLLCCSRCIRVPLFAFVYSSLAAEDNAAASEAALDHGCLQTRYYKAGNASRLPKGPSWIQADPKDLHSPVYHVYFGNTRHLGPPIWVTWLSRGAPGTFRAPRPSLGPWALDFFVGRSQRSRLH